MEGHGKVHGCLSLHILLFALALDSGKEEEAEGGRRNFGLGRLCLPKFLALDMKTAQTARDMDTQVSNVSSPVFRYVCNLLVI